MASTGSETFGMQTSRWLHTFPENGQCSQHIEQCCFAHTQGCYCNAAVDLTCHVQHASQLWHVLLLESSLPARFLLRCPAENRQILWCVKLNILSTKEAFFVTLLVLVGISSGKVLLEIVH